MSDTGVFVPRVSCSHSLPLQEILQGQQVDLAQAPIKVLLLPWVLVHMRFCVSPLRVKSFSPSLVGLLQLSPTGLQSEMVWGLLFLVLDLQTGVLTWGSTFSLWWENFCNIIILQFVDCASEDYGICLYGESTPPTSLVFISSLCL